MGIEFVGDPLKVLSQSLLAVTPTEGCALLIGKYKESISLTQDNSIQIQMIWPCCNVWEPDIFGLVESPQKANSAVQEKLSKENRFVIDPREQLLAQHWARKHHLEIVGSAHSHPSGDSIPSSVDCLWSFSPGLIVIIDQYGGARAWWMEQSQTLHPKEVAIWSLK